MTSGINDTNSVKKTLGSRLQTARERKGKAFSRQVVVDLLNAHPKAPSFMSRKMLQEGTYKKWEYGVNSIELEWLPAICDVLDCDVGYLFGEYEEQHRVSADIASETGLTESAIQKLRSINLSQEEYPSVISALIEDINFEYLLCLLNGRFLYSVPKYNVQPVVEIENGAAHLRNAQNFHKSIIESETKIQFDDLTLIAKKQNLLDSMISSAVIDRMKNMADTYHNIQEMRSGNG